MPALNPCPAASGMNCPSKFSEAKTSVPRGKKGFSEAIFINTSSLILLIFDFLIKGREIKMAAKKPFGGYNICFKGCADSMEKVFGTSKLAPSEMTKKLWAYVKSKKLSGKS